MEWILVLWPTILVKPKLELRTELYHMIASIAWLNSLLPTKLTKGERNLYSDFGLNRSLKEYYQADTLDEILLARRFFQINKPINPSEMVVISALMHILHGNRPYALSRKSHPITPYAPTGDYIYKSLIGKLIEKVDKFYSEPLNDTFNEGQIFLQDSTLTWPEVVSDLDAVITSPPFFDSTRFYNANWIRLWFSGWEPADFKTMPSSYVDERQKKSLSVYYPIFQQAKDRLKNGGVMVLHLGKSPKCNYGCRTATHSIKLVLSRRIV